MFWGLFFEGGDKILLLGEALKFGVIFQKIALKLLNLRKNAKFSRTFVFCAHCEEKELIYIRAIMVGIGGGAPQVESFQLFYQKIQIFRNSNNILISNGHLMQQKLVSYNPLKIR